VVIYKRLVKENGQDAKSGKLLALCTGFASQVALVRVIYGIVYAFHQSPTLNPVTGSFGVHFTFFFLMQLLAVGCLLTGGLLTRKITSARTGQVEDFEHCEH
jgi:hypothetical protein